MKKGRIFQDYAFTFSDFNGLKLEKIVACILPEKQSVAIVFIKVENHCWHQYFLDFGIGFWENWEMQTIDTEDDDCEFIDQTEHFGLKNATISAIECKEDEFKNSQISIFFQGGKTLVLRYENLEDEKKILELTDNILQ